MTPFRKKRAAAFLVTILIGLVLGQTLYSLVLDDYLQTRPPGLDHFSCVKELNGRTAALPAGRAAVLSVDVNLFFERSGAGDASERERRFDRLLRHFEALSHGAGADRVLLLFFPGRPHLAPHNGLGGWQVASLKQYRLERYVLLECPESAAARLAERIVPLPGLYLLEDGRVRYRYISYPWHLPGDLEFERAVLDVVGRDVRSFLEGGTPEHAPAPLLDLNVEVPAGLKDVVGEEKFLLLSFSGLEAEAPAEDRMIVERRTGQLGEGGAVPRFESGHPGAAGRRVIERLTPLLTKYDLAAVGLVKESGRTEAMRRAFPGWRFVALGTAEDYLGYWEALNQGFFVSRYRTRHAFAITPFDMGYGEPFEKILRDWLR